MNGDQSSIVCWSFSEKPLCWAVQLHVILCSNGAEGENGKVVHHVVVVIVIVIVRANS